MATREDFRDLMRLRQAAAVALGDTWPDPWGAVPPAFQAAKLDDFPLEPDLVGWADRYLDALWAARDRRGNVLLYGRPLRGKTYTAFALMRRFSGERVGWRWTTPARFFRLQRSLMGDGADPRAQMALDVLRDAPVLLLDDLSAPSTNWQFDQLGELLCARFEAEHPTVTTSNLGYDELVGHYGEPLVRRLADEGRGDLVVER